MASTHTSRWRRLLPSLWWAAAIILLLMAAYVVVGRQLMLLVPDYRERLEHLFEERIQTPLTIAELNGTMSGLVPQFVARQIRLPAPEGEAPLVLDEVVLSIDVFRSLWHRDLVLEEFSVRGVDLNLVRGEDGKIRLRGLDVLGQSDPESRPPLERILKLFYRQQLLSISDARLSLEWPGMPPLAASQLDATMTNTGGEHRLAVRVEARDRPLSLLAKIHLHDDAYTLDEVDADIYTRFEGKRLHEWLPDIEKMPLDLGSLDASVALWGTLEGGEPISGQLQVDVPTLTLTEADTAWPLTGLSLRASLLREDDEATLSLSNLSGKTPSGPLTLGDMALRWETRGERRQWQLRANELPVHAISQQFQSWPFSLPAPADKVRTQLSVLSPRGVVEGVYLSGHARDLEQFQMRFAGLASQADDRIPGVKGLNGWVAGAPDAGLAHLYSDDLALRLPRLYDHELGGQMAGVFGWQRQGDALTVRSSRLRVVNPDAHGEAMVAVTVRPEQVPELRLVAEIYDGNGARANHYIPLKRLPDGLSGWLGQAIGDGHLQRGQLLYQGPVKIDKSRQQDRTFQMRYQGEDVRLSFLPDWPQATGVNADVWINGREVQGVASRGNLLNSQVADVHVDVPAFDDETGPRVIVTGKVHGPLSDLDTVFQDTPLTEQLPDEVKDWRYQSGTMGGQLTLNIPLKKGEGAPMVIVDASVADGRVENTERNLLLTEVQAPVYFHLRDGLQMSQLSASTLGGKVTGKWTTGAGKSTLALEGAVPVKSVREWLGFNWLAPASGSLPLALTIQVPWQGTHFALHATSSLKGVTVKAPAPLGKSAAQTRALTLDLTGNGQRLGLQYGDVVRGAFALGETVRGDLRLGAGTPRIPASGIDVHGRLARASVEPWIDFVSDQLAPAMEDNTSDSGGNGGQQGGLNKVNVQVATLDLFGVDVPAASLSVLPSGKGWDLALSSPTVAGSMTIPEGFSARGDAPLNLSVSRMNLTLPESADPKSGAPLSPMSLPAVDARLANLRINGEDFGEWQADLRPTAQGVRINNLQGRWRASRIQGTVDWTEDSGNQYTRFNGSLASDNLGRSLSAWGLPEMIESDDASAKVSLGWPQWPLAPDYLALDGQARVDIGECRIPDTDTKTSFLRLLGILNLGTIQRRLRLDFSDLYKKGLSCDSISGDFAIDGPQVSTSNLAIDSPSAAIRVKGAIDLEKETLNHQMEVTLPLSSNLYAGCLAGPAACAGIFVVERIWGDKLDKTATMEYRVSGSWSNPKVSETEGIFE